jgi:hypothetical protein
MHCINRAWTAGDFKAIAVPVSDLINLDKFVRFLEAFRPTHPPGESTLKK